MINILVDTVMYNVVDIIMHLIGLFTGHFCQCGHVFKSICPVRGNNLGIIPSNS